MNKLGVATLTFNGLGYTKALIDSVVKSSIGVPFDFVIVDNGSTDGTEEYIKSLKLNEVHEKCLSITHALNGKNVGCAAGWNQGLSICFDKNCDSVIEVNNDIKFHPKCIQNMFDMSEKYEEFGFLTAVDNKEGYLTAELKEEIWEGLCWSCFLIKKWAWNRNGRFDENIRMMKGEDYDYAGRLIGNGVRTASFRNCSVFHEGNGAGKANRDINWAAHLAQNQEYIKKKGEMIFGGKLGWEADGTQEELRNIAPEKKEIKL